VAQAVGANRDDFYLSVLPLSLLLETICAVVIPILAGARVRLEPELAAGFDRADGGRLAAAVERHRPSCLVLVPELLARWAARLEETNAAAPAGLRVVAVGGAAVPARLAERAWRRNIPVFEGYGLSEGGSVVTLNAPGARREGTAGRPLPGLRVTAEDGEITVRGPSVMDRYLHGAATGGVWRTGDVGALDRDGYLIVHGRRDNLLVTPSGRNISPEWIEAMLAADIARVGHCMVTLDAEGELTAIIIPTAEGAQWFVASSNAAIHALIAEYCREAPGYAVPRRVIWLPETDPVAAGLVTGNGRIRRATLRTVALCAVGARHRQFDTDTVTEQRAES
jgi:long-subunit acyl-CoA synthetase (AMP-forming)